MDSTTIRDSTTDSAATLNIKPCVLYYLLFGTLGCGFTIVIGLVGNCLSLIILRRERKKSSTIQALCLLAVADALVLLAYLPTIPVMGIWATLYGLHESINLVVVSSVYIYEATRICNQVSTFLTMILMWQRYVAVCLPHKAKQLCTVRMVNRIAACSSVAAFAFYLPNFFLYSIRTRQDGIFYPESHSLMRNAYFQMIYSVILTYLVSYIIPVVSLLYMSVAILRSFKANKNSAPSLNSQQARNDLTKSSITIFIVFVICQSFLPIRRVLKWVYDPYVQSLSCGGDLFFFAGTPHIMLTLNSSANFGIYIIFAKGFRKKLYAIIARRNIVAPNNETMKPGPGTSNTHAFKQELK